MPGVDDINMPWLKQILSGKKKLIRNADLCTVTVPRIPESSCEKLYLAAIDDLDAKVYLPDPGLDRKRNVSRKYLFNSKSIYLAHRWCF